MKKAIKIMRYFLYLSLFLCAAWVASMAYVQISAYRSGEAADLTTWLPKKRILQLMRFHGTDILKVTPDEVYIFRGSKWVPVMRRGQG